MNCSLPAPQPGSLAQLAQCTGSPRPKATQLVCGRAGLAREALDNPIRRPCGGSWQTSGLAWPIIPFCTPASPFAELTALSLAPRPTTSSCWIQGHGCWPHLSFVLTCSVKALQTWDSLPLGWEPEWPLSGQALPGLRPSMPRCLQHPEDLPPPHYQLLCGLLGSSPSWLALLLAPRVLPLPLPPSREGRVLFLAPLCGCPSQPPTLALVAASLYRAPARLWAASSSWPPHSSQFHWRLSHPLLKRSGRPPSLLLFVVSPAPHTCDSGHVTLSLWASVACSVNQGCCGVPGR